MSAEALATAEAVEGALPTCGKLFAEPLVLSDRKGSFRFYPMEPPSDKCADHIS